MRRRKEKEDEKRKGEERGRRTPQPDPIFSCSPSILFIGMGDLERKVKEKAREVKLFLKSKEFKRFLKKAKKVVGKTCKKGWKQVQKLSK